MRNYLRNAAWILPLGLGVGLLLSFLDGGIFWMGLLAYSIMMILGLLILFALFRSAGVSRLMGIILLLTIFLRLGLGIAFSYVLPPNSNANEVLNAGYVFRDSYTRDTQAWKLASSSESLWSAFDRSKSIDQYGGMLFVSATLYRYLSPDSHRPWLVILVGALAAAIGVILAWKAVRKVWSEPMAWGTAWIMALFPESILLGSSQMREPFLITFVIMLFWGVINWSENKRNSAAWSAGGIIGMLLFNPSIAVAAIIILSIWVLIREKGQRVTRVWWIVGGVATALFATIVFIGAVGSSLLVHSGPFESLLNWFRYSAQWDAYLLEVHSGWIQNVFDRLPAFLHFPFIIGYGIMQPVLPAAIADPAAWPMRVLGILRGLGWYAFLPMLVYSLRPIIKIPEKRERFAWLWLFIMTWGWIILSAARAGGDQWDNPRYRAILLIFQASLVSQTIIWQRVTKDRWLWRFLAVEGVFLVLFGYWYIARYTGWQAGQVDIFVIIALIVIISIFILVGGWISDRRRVRRT
jgi:hypothetical protein